MNKHMHKTNLTNLSTEKKTNTQSASDRFSLPISHLRKSFGGHIKYPYLPRIFSSWMSQSMENSFHITIKNGASVPSEIFPGLFMILQVKQPAKVIHSLQGDYTPPKKMNMHETRNVFPQLKSEKSNLNLNQSPPS